MELRQAILSAAKTLENPRLWDWERCSIPECGSPGCAIGWILHHAGYSPRESFAGFPDLAGCSEMDFYRRMGDIDLHWKNNVSKCLRLYADKYHPAEPLKVLPSGSEICRLIIAKPFKETADAA